jgi:hypothetical protein
MNFCSECGRRLVRRPSFSTVPPSKRDNYPAWVMVCPCGEEANDCRCLPVDYTLASTVINTSPDAKCSAKK